MNQFVAINKYEGLEPNHDALFLLAPGHSKLKIVYKPKIELIDFVTYVLICLIFWFGWAPLPFLLGLKFFAVNKTAFKAIHPERHCSLKPIVNQLIVESEAHKERTSRLEQLLGISV